MMLRGFSFVLILCGAALCQSPPITFGDFLQQHHVALTKESLLDALKNPDPQVRSTAANKLAEDKAEDTIPAIFDAMVLEQFPFTRVNIALALAELRDERGFAALKTACDDPDTEGFVRARSAEYLLQLHRESCPNAILDVLQADVQDGSRGVAISLVPQFKDSSSKDFQRMVDVLVEFLTNDELSWKIQANDKLLAAISLSEIGDPAVIPSLQDALQTEGDEAVRRSLRDAIEAIQKKQAERVLFDRATAAMDAGRFDVAKLSLQTLINTYPGTEYARRARLALEDPRLANCGESFSLPSSPCASGESADPDNK